MTVIVRDDGFHPEDWQGGFDGPEAQDLAPDTDPGALADLPGGLRLIRIAFPGFADGRGFTLARLLREAGFAGRLRAAGHVLADQYVMARRAGFDEVEIGRELARRQPEAQWLARAGWRKLDYQSRLRAGCGL